MCIGTSELDGGLMELDLAAPADAAVTGPKYVFLTSFTYTGNFGGLVGADNICSTLAASVGHAGAWVAWLSDETTNAIDRINDVGPWYAMGTSRVVAQTKASFAYTPASAVANDQNGLGNSNLHDIWVGTKVGGTRAPGETCQSWTSGAMADHGAFVREAGAATGGWTYYGAFICNSSYQLACIQQ